MSSRQSCEVRLAGLSHKFPSADRISDASNKVPRFLFRGWNEFSGGQHFPQWKDLNTQKYINTHVNHRNPDKVIGPVWAIPNLVEMIRSHTTWKKVIPSEFSSWTHNLDTAVGYNYMHNGKDGYISVIDRLRLWRDVKIYHTVDLSGIFGTDSKPWEYLAHGSIEGPGLFCVPTSKLLSPIIPRGLSFQAGPPTPRNLIVADGITFARRFLGEFATEDSPLLYFLIPTRICNQSFGEKSKCPIALGSDVENFCLFLSRAIEAETGFPLPVEFAGEFLDPPTDLGKYPKARRPILLLQAMSHYTWGLKRAVNQSEIILDMDRLDMMELDDDKADHDSALIRSNRIRDLELAKSERMDID